MSSPYTALDSSRKEIRLLDLQPSADHSSALTCTSRTVSLFDKPPYAALSYCWGGGTDTTEITLNGVTGFAVPRNLCAALRQLRDGTDIKVLWADAICINQDPSTPEKNQQVAMMRDIYAQAISTIIWLGDEDDNSDLAMETISHLHEHDIWELDNQALSASHFEAIAAINARPWWSRVWVIQELLLSPNPTVMCGSKSAPIEAFIHLDDLRRGYHRPSDETIDNASQPSRHLFRQHAFSQVLHHYFDDKQRVQTGVVKLEEWVVVIDNFNATDPRDKIYGLLGLGTDYDRLALPPDYSPANTVANVYARATARFILQGQGLLHLQFNINDVDAAFGLPSWCPDYSCDANKIKERYTAFVVGMHGKKPFNAGGNMGSPSSASQDDLFPKSREGNWRELHLRGWEIDEVDYVGVNAYMEPYVGNDITERLANNARRAEQTRSNILTWEPKVQKRLATANPYAPKTADDIFWRTIMANANFAWISVPDSWKGYFDVWLDRIPVPPSAACLTQDEKEAKRLYVKPYTDAAITRPHGRAFVITKKGYLGLAPRKTRVGDVVSVLRGGDVPFILRRRVRSGQKEEEETWEFVGESFVLGLMEGQGIGLGEESRFAIL